MENGLAGTAPGTWPEEAAEWSEGAAWPAGTGAPGAVPPFPGQPAFDPTALAAMMSAAAAQTSGQTPGIPHGFPGWPGASSWPRPPVSWPQQDSSAAPLQPPLAQPPAQPPVQPPTQMPGGSLPQAAQSATGQTASGSQPGAAAWNEKENAKQQALIALWAHQYAAQMVASQQQYGGWPPQPGSAPQWPHAGSSPWPAWPDAPAWPASAGSTADDSWASYAQGLTAGFPEGGVASAPSGAASDTVPPADASAIAGEAQAQAPVEAEPGDEEAHNDLELDAEGQALREDISSAVAKFLADDGFCDSDSEPEPDEDSENIQAPIQSASPATAPPPAQASPPSHHVPVQPPVRNPPPTSAVPPPPQGPPPGPPVHLASSAFAAAGLVGTTAPAPPPYNASIGTTSVPTTLTSLNAGQENTPSPERVQDFLNVLRKRALPAELTEDKQKHISGVVNSCVLSLYRDRIRPVQNNVQRRLRERSCSEAIVQALLPICARESDTYRILPPSGSRLPVILFLQEPKWFEGFVDTEAPDNNYSTDCWEAMAKFLRDDNVTLPSQPYQAALELRQRNLQHLNNLCLGELEHMVRLCLGRRKWLMFNGDTLKPVRDHPSATGDKRMQKMKDDIEDLKAKGVIKVGRVAQNDAPPQNSAISADGFPDEIMDKDDLTVVLMQLMARFPEGVSLSLMKQHVLRHCKRNLNEAQFKCSKLAEVFKLSPLSTIFPLEQVAHRNEIIVRPPNKDAIPAHIWQKYYHFKEHGTIASSAAV